MGVNTNFAPDADVNVNPLNPVIGTRSFSSEPGARRRDGRRAGRRLPGGRQGRRQRQALPRPR